MNMTTDKPWYRHFWVWFAIAFPCSAVLAGLLTLFLAIHGADREVSGNYRRVGLAVVVGAEHRGGAGHSP